MIRIVGTEIEIDRIRKTVRNGAYKWTFSSTREKRFVKLRLLEALLMNAPFGMTAKELCEVLYADCEDGGPLYGSRVVEVMLQKLSLEKLNLRLLKHKHCEGMRYSVAPK